MACSYWGRGERTAEVLEGFGWAAADGCYDVCKAEGQDREKGEVCIKALKALDLKVYSEVEELGRYKEIYDRASEVKTKLLE